MTSETSSTVHTPLSVQLTQPSAHTSCWVSQGIFLHIDCVPFWDAAPFHWDAAPPDFRSLRPKRKTGCPVMLAFLYTMSRLPHYPAAYPLSCHPFCHALRPVPQSIMPFALSRSAPCLVLPNVLRFALSHAFLSCPCTVLSCSALPQGRIQPVALGGAN